MTATYDRIATQTLGSNTYTVTFSSIPATYTDLVLVCSVRDTNGSGTISADMQLNSDSGSNYSTTVLRGNGSTADSLRSTSSTVMTYNYYPNGATSAFGTVIFNLMNYANTTTNKTVLIRSNNPEGNLTANVSLWRNTAAINTVAVRSNTAFFVTGSTFTLYGIKAE